MRSWRNPGLGARLAVAFVAISGVVILAYGYLASRRAELVLKDELGEKLESIAKLAAADDKVRALPYAIRAGAVVEAARPRLANLAAVAGIGNLMVVDKEGDEHRVIVDARGRFQFHDPAWLLRLDQAELNQVWQGRIAYSPMYQGEDGQLYLSAYAPLSVGGTVVLVVGAEASAVFLHRIRLLRNRLFTIGLIVLGFAAVLGWLVAQSITGPLRRLRVAVEQVERGDFTATANVEAGHEVGELARAFNRMAQAINVRHEEILESMSNGLIAVDARGHVAEVNPAAEQLLGVRRDALLGRPFRDRLPEEFSQALSETLAGDEPLHGENLTVPTPAGPRIFGVSTSPLPRGGADIFFLDVTEIARLTAELETQQRFAAIGEMAAEVAHQIRNPLAAIQGFADLLKAEMRAQGKGKEYLDDLLKEVRTTEGIVSNFLAYARPSRLELKPLVMGEAVRDVCRTMQPEFDRAGVALEPVVEPAVPVISADAATVQQVLANLLRNALEACRAGGHVRVRATAEHDTAATNGAGERGGASGVVVTVEDDGTGLSPDILPRLFTPFVTTKAQGTGLGLSFAKKFVEAHGGSIALMPLPRGVRAEVHLPVEPREGLGVPPLTAAAGRA